MAATSARAPGGSRFFAPWIGVEQTLMQCWSSPITIALSVNARVGCDARRRAMDDAELVRVIGMKSQRTALRQMLTQSDGLRKIRVMVCL